MTVSRRVLCTSYAVIGLLALMGTWGNILGLVAQNGFFGGTVKFWRDVLINESSRFITVDMLFLGLAVILWMVLEARRLEIPGVWLYIAFGVLIAISLAVPLFMIHRELRLAVVDPGSAAGTLGLGDVVGIVGCGTAFAAFAVLALAR
jgi:hypothetical protein